MKEAGATEVGIVIGAETKMDTTETKEMATTETDPLDLSHWQKVVILAHVAFQEGRMVEEAMWHAVVMITKGGRDYHGIVLLEVVWKVVTAIINCRFTVSIYLHDVLHFSGRVVAQALPPSTPNCFST